MKFNIFLNINPTSLPQQTLHRFRICKSKYQSSRLKKKRWYEIKRAWSLFKTVIETSQKALRDSGNSTWNFNQRNRYELKGAFNYTGCICLTSWIPWLYLRGLRNGVVWLTRLFAIYLTDKFESYHHYNYCKCKHIT